MKEEWKPMYGHEKEYECSSFGSIRSLPRVIIRKNGRQHTIRPKILRPATDVNGYKRIAISSNKRLITKKVHREILKAFNPIENMDKLECDHLSGDKSDNSLANLEWVTKSENIKRSFKNGLQDNFLAGAKRHNRSLRKLDKKKIQLMINEYNSSKTSYQKIADKYGVSKKTAMQAMKGQTYRD